jgi:hypothetical protein
VDTDCHLDDEDDLDENAWPGEDDLGESVWPGEDDLGESVWPGESVWDPLEDWLDGFADHDAHS